MNHVVKVQLHFLESRYADTYVDECILELQQITDWLDELVQWQPDKYQMTFAQPNELDIWFEEEKHAIMCTLRWT